MKEWMTAREIATQALPGLPTTESAVVRWAKRENWSENPAYARRRDAIGGGFEYHFNLLPTLAQVDYVQRHMVTGRLPEAEAVPAVAISSDLSDRARSERDARLAIVAAFEKFAQGQRMAVQAAMFIFCDRYNLGGFFQVEEWVKKLLPKISQRSVFRWRTAKSNGANDALAVDRSTCRKGSGLLETAADGRVKSFILAWVAANPALSAETIKGYVEDEFGAELVDRQGVLKPLPSDRTFQLFLKTLKQTEKVVLTKITNPDKYRSTMKLSGTGAYRHVTEANGLWMIDASPVDALCIDGRHSLYACIDIATRRLVITLSKTPRASAVGLMMRKAMLKWGVARIVKTDNGSDFVAVETKRLFSAVDIEVDISDAYSPEQKGHVERVIKTFQHEVCPQLPGYVGHNVADRKAIEDRKSFAARLGQTENETFSVSLTAEQLQRHIDDWLEHVYHHRKHGGLKNGLTPQQAADASNEVIRRIDERALDVLLMPVARRNGICRMTKQGIKLNNFKYLTGSILAGTDVFVRLDPLDMGKIHLFAVDDGRYLDVAICAELSEINRPAFVKAKKEEYNRMVGERAREINADVRKLLKGPSGIERTIRLAKRKSAEREAAAANVIQLPRREENHSTPQIAAALDAATAPVVHAAAKQSAAIVELQAAIERDLAPPAASGNMTPIRSAPTAAQRFQTAREIEERIAAGHTPATEEALWLGSYRASAEYKTQKTMWEDFGDQAPGLRT
ncbi:DDE-type integrase/transposase/recombinase [Pararhizobium sp.]|uniref:DDE-type integrase/transposase/recombinase n=1 Tax=Pararhizobium sp. TaxID=1977563 RepID=UPI003D0E24B5